MKDCKTQRIRLRSNQAEIPILISQRETILNIGLIQSKLLLMPKSITMYKEYEAKMKREGLFQLISKSFDIRSAIYPGSYIHISPSFYFQEVVYVDMDKRGKPFFSDPTILSFISEKKIYSELPIIRFHPQDYSKKLPESKETFDLLISQYAGFVSQSCKKYLKSQGLLLVNNSHGDAGVAFLDPDYDLIGAINYRSDKFTLSQKNLEKYFIPKKSIKSYSILYLLSLNRGIGYSKSASHYLFQKC